jgi:ferredoxin
MTVDRHRGCFPAVTQIASPSESDVDTDRARAFLREQTRILEDQKEEMDQTIRQLETRQNLVAVVLTERCAGCGICADVCPANAIKVDDHALIDDELCVGCRCCVSECPSDAIILTSGTSP